MRIDPIYARTRICCCRVSGAFTSCFHTVLLFFFWIEFCCFCDVLVYSGTLHPLPVPIYISGFCLYCLSHSPLTHTIFGAYCCNNFLHQVRKIWRRANRACIDLSGFMPMSFCFWLHLNLNLCVIDSAAATSV